MEKEILQNELPIHGRVHRTYDRAAGTDTGDYGGAAAANQDLAQAEKVIRKRTDRSIRCSHWCSN